jgi:hypothetical protein
MLACRACRVPIAAAKGCAICDPVRTNLVVVGEDEDDKPSLSGTASLGVSILNRQLRDVEKNLKANGRSVTDEKRAIALTNAISKLLETSRKLMQDGVDLMETYSFREQAELFVGWFANLSPPYRADVMAKFAAFEQEISKPVGEPPHVDN